MIRGSNAEQMAAFSSRGPTDDGRIKPDVVAPGVSVKSLRVKRRPGRARGEEADGADLIDVTFSVSGFKPLPPPWILILSPSSPSNTI